MKKSKEYNKELSQLESQLTNLYSDIETTIARLIKKNHLEDVIWTIENYPPFKAYIKPAVIEITDTMTGDKYIIHEFMFPKDYPLFLEKIEEYLDKVLI